MQRGLSPLPILVTQKAARLGGRFVLAGATSSRAGALHIQSDRHRRDAAVFPDVCFYHAVWCEAL